MITIQDINSQRFSLNGIQYFKNFMSYVSGDNVRLVNVYDSKFNLLPFTAYTEISLNGVVHDSAAELQEALLSVVFTRHNLGAIGDGTWGSVAGDINNQTDLINYIAAQIAAIPSGDGGSYSKERFTIGQGVSTIQLTDDPLPKMIEIFEVQSYMPEGESLFYTYNNATGEIEFNFTFDVETTLHITKYF